MASAYGLLLRLLSRFPLPLLHVLGALIGQLIYFSSAAYRRHLRENFSRAFPEPASRQLRAAAAHAGRTVLETPVVWMRAPHEVLGLVQQVSGWELVDRARKGGHGLIFVTPHLGCFEITSKYIAARLPITILFRPPKQEWLAPIMEAGRGGPNIVQARTDVGGVRLLMRALKRHEAIGLLPDQVPGTGEGLWADFFGVPAYTMTLLARLAEMPRTTVVFIYGERLAGGAGFHVRCLAPPVPIEGSLVQRTAAINHCVEALIRECPEQYLWGYNRYKRPQGAEAPPGAAGGGAG